MANTKRLHVKVGETVYTVDVVKSFFRKNLWTAIFLDQEIDNFEQSWPVTAKDVVEYIEEEYPERV